MDDTANLRRMADARDGSDPLAALALSGAADEIDRLRAAFRTQARMFGVSDGDIAAVLTPEKEP